ncbi:MAG: trypsin-like peptidase domain-containing protein, partial [Planctomycetes bacterium]|nr:trypsin-like peptidase domain-containing protein [Planctomycetota bacterium]
MAIRMVCPSCKTPNTVNDDKRGRKVRCRECEEPISVPAAKNREAEAVQEKRSLKIKSSKAARQDDDDDEDDRRPVPKKKNEPDKKNATPMLLIGGIAAVLLLCLLGGGGIGAFFFFRNKPDAPKNDPPGQADAQKDSKKGDEPIPSELPPDLVPKIKQATVYLRVTMPTGQVAEGSGFFALERGIVITNAHVLGMLGAKSQPPNNVQVVLNSGEVNERQMVGNVLGVDRTCDLAVVRVNEGNLPTPLQVDAREPIETQKVYIFGFPFGAELGKNITVSSSTVSSLRRDQATRELDQIQVNGGMHPGNSGGPVVNAAGKLIGVSVAGIRGTQINFAVPADKVRLIMEGRLADTKQGEAYMQGAQTLLPVQFTCLDPLNRVQKMHVEVWAGTPGQPRPYSRQKPPAAAGDGPRQSHAVSYRNFTGSADVPLPAVGVGQVHWVQPVITTSSGATHWGPATPTSLFIPLERKDVDLRASLTSVRERTIRLKNSATITLFKGKQKKSFAEVLEGEVLESLSPDPKGALIRTAIGAFNVRAEEDGRNVAFDPEVPPYLRAIPPVFVVDGTNKLRARSDRSLGNTKMSPLLRAQVEANYAQLCNAIEAVNVPMPNRMLRPTDRWIVEVPMLLETGKKPEVADLVLNCIYEGVRARKQRSEAVITLAGNVRGRGASVNKIAGDVTGKIVFDLTGGFITAAKLNISTERSTPGGEMQILYGFDIELTRLPGNIAKIMLPGEKSKPGPVAKGKVLINTNAALLATDPLEKTPALRGKGARMRIHPLQMQAGKTYYIALNSAAFDSYLRLEDPTGQTVAKDDDSGGFP